MRTTALLFFVGLSACGDKNDGDTAAAVDLDGDGFTIDDGDCDDADPAIHPGADELCDGIDNDCDSVADDDPVDGGTFYADGDGDGFGDPGDAVVWCGPPAGYVADNTDCNDTSYSVNPSSVEVCNGTDDDCDGEVDNDASDAVPYYADADGDGYGDDEIVLAACQRPDGYAGDGGDCDDASDSVHPGAVERCNGIDDDCDPVTLDENVVGIGGAAYSSIGAAVAAAADGDTLTVCPGTYAENVVIDGTDLTVAGAGAADTRIDAQGAGAAILIQGGAAVTVRGLTLLGGSADDGAGISAAAAGDVTVEDAEITGGTAIRGGGIYGPEAALLSLSDVLIYENLATSGGGVYAARSDMLAVAVHSNVADLGGGLYLDGGSHQLDKSSEIYLNEALENGGGVYAQSAILDAAGATIRQNSTEGSGGGLWLAEGQLDGGSVESNTATVGGGIYWAGETSGRISSVTISANSASDHGGGLAASGDRLEIDACTIERNSASSGFGGGLYGDRLTDALITSSIIDGNTGLLGGGMVLMSSTVEIERTDITDNSGGFGGGGYLYDAEVSLEGGAVTTNSATISAGGFYIDSDAELAVDGVDFGASSTDNDPDDIYVYNGADPEVYDSYGTYATFSCDDSVCR